MEQSASRIFFTLFFTFLFLFTQAGEFYDREEIQSRLESMDCIVKPRYTTSVESYIKGYFGNDAYKAKLVLGRTVTYFPIFEKYLDKYNMPDDLKYLAIVESALDPKAVSRVGATGLWQFMKETGISYGLKINSRIDERSCPTRSTIAALEYLAKAYKRFGSWELAIASYNCGAGNVRRAMKRAGGSNDYWKISRYLPRETRNFVPAFIGAAYMAKFYHLHGVAPIYSDLDLQLTEGELVYEEIHFETIAAVAGLPMEVVKQLNPAYKRGYVPANVNGHWVILPRRTMQALKDYIQLLRPDNGSTSELPPLPELVNIADYAPVDYYYETLYTTLNGDRFSELGEIFQCAGHNLRTWNGLVSNDLSQVQELVVWFPKKISRYLPFNEKVDVLSIETYAPRRFERVRPHTPKIKPIKAIKLMPVKALEQIELPFAAMSIAKAELKLATEQNEIKPEPPKTKSQMNKKRFFKRKNKNSK